MKPLIKNLLALIFSSTLVINSTGLMRVNAVEVAMISSSNPNISKIKKL